jgi:hypothetical protein
MTTKDMIWTFVIALVAIYLVEHNVLGLGELLAKKV